jgi:LemA protein
MDPSSEARVDRMEADGLITAKQADMLRASMAAGASRSQAARLRRSPGLMWLAAGLILATSLVVVAVVFQPAAGPLEVQDVSDILNQPDGVGAMNRSLMTALVLVVFLAVAAGLFLWTYNGLVNREEQVFAAWGQVESNLQRRADLTPQLVETVSRYLRHEGETFQNIAEARSQDTAALQSAIDDLAKAMQDSAEQLQRSGERIVEEEDSLGALAAAQARMDRSINTLMATAEAYPELRSSDQFLELQAQLEGTENRVNVTRMRFNELVGDYNASIRRVPGALVATVGNFRRKAYFQADGEARNAPDLDFD